MSEISNHVSRWIIHVTSYTDSDRSSLNKTSLIQSKKNRKAKVKFQESQ